MGFDEMYPSLLKSWPMSLKIQLNYLWKVMARGVGQEEIECQEEQEGLENYRPGKVTKQIILGTISKDMKDKERIRDSQHKVSKRKSCLANLMAFYN